MHTGRIRSRRQKTLHHHERSVGVSVLRNQRSAYREIRALVERFRETLPEGVEFDFQWSERRRVPTPRAANACALG